MKFLHLSDIHFNPKSDGRATRDLREKFKQYAYEKSIIDIDELFFTGDFRHALKQIDQPDDEVSNNAIDFLRDIASCVGVEGDSHIHIVPGNHDLSRESNSNMNSRNLSAVYNKYDSNDGIFAGYVKKDIPSLDYLRNRFGFFEECVRQLNNQVWADFKNGLLHRAEPCSGTDEYNILYVNTAIASGCDKFKHNLLLGTNDFDKALRSTDGQLVIILAHNPLSHLALEEQNIVKNIIKDRKIPVIWLCGDAHKSLYENSYDIACITTGCMIQQSGTEASFIVGEFTPYDGLTLTAHGYAPDHGYWQLEEALSKRIEESIPEAIRALKDKGLTKVNNLPSQNIHFTGRINTLRDMNKYLGKMNINALNICQTVAGLGGIGKTQLAIEYAYRYCGNFKNAIWFVIAESSTTAYNHFKLFADKLSLPLPADFTPEDLQQAVRGWLSDNKDWLLILDNLDSYEVIKPYLPVNKNGRLIITTRNARIDIGQQIEIGVFSLEEALEFFKKRFSKDDKLNLEYYRYKDFDEQAPNLAKRLGYLPLALEQAAAYIRIVKCSITDYLILLGESGIVAFENNYATPEYYEDIVNSTWNISFNAIKREAAKQLLNLCAYMAPDRIPVSFFVEMREKLPSPLKEELAQKMTTFDIVTELRDYSLVSGDAEFMDIHRLVQEVVRRSHGEQNK